MHPRQDSWQARCLPNQQAGSLRHKLDACRVKIWTAKFHEILESIQPHLPESTDRGKDVGELPPIYLDAKSVEFIAWDHREHHYQLICFLSHAGGSIDAVIDGQTDWHNDTLSF